MLDVAVLEDPATAAAALDPVRAVLLRELAAEPASAAGVAARLGLPRQRVGHHLRALEALGLVELAEVRAHGGLEERVLRATAATFVVSPAALAEAGARPELVADRMSAGHLVALAGRLVREVGQQASAASAAGLRLPTLSIDAEVAFASPEARAAFAQALTEAVTALVAEHHVDGGRRHRVVVASHPAPEEAP